MTSSEEDAQVGGLGVGDDRLHAVVRLRPLEVLFRRFRIGTLLVHKLRSRKFTTQNDLYE